MHLPFYFNFRSLDLDRGVLKYAMLLVKMEIISRVEPFDPRYNIFRGHRSAWFRLTACRFTEFDTCNLPSAYTLFLLVSVVRYDLRF